jgi:quinol monooxygenase YgiN
MLVVEVFVSVKPDSVEAFKEATLKNARASLDEPGIARFDVLQMQDDPTKFLLTEVYRTEDAPAKHKETSHYQMWRDTVADMMASQRQSMKYNNVFPDDQDWN